MKKLLFINACIRDGESRTLNIAKYYIEKYLENNKDFSIEELKLNDAEIEIQNLDFLKFREEKMLKKEFDNPIFDLANQFLSADDILIAAPYWDLQFPAVLKIYLERISVPDLTYVYDEMGIPRGQSKAKDVTYITTSGGPTEGMNFGFDYINGLFTKLFGFENVREFSAEGIDIIGVDSSKIISETKQKIDDFFDN